MSLLSLCNKTVTIKRKTVTASNGGGHVETFTTIYSNLPACIQPARGSTMERFARESMIADYTIYTPSTISLKPGDLVYDDATSVTYNVKSWGDMAGRKKAYVIYTQRID